MKKIGFIILLLLAVLLKTTIGYTKAEDQQLIDLVTAVEKQHLAVHEWEVTLKEEMDHTEAKQRLEDLQESYSVNKEVDEEAVKYSFYDTHHSNEISEYYSVIVPKNPKYQAEMAAVISGENWNEKIRKEYTSTINARMKDMFTNQTHKFACLTTYTNGTISSDVFLDTFKEDLNVKNVSTQSDNVQHSTIKKIMYGYIPKWKQSMDVNGEALNVQVAVSSDESNTKLTIGTPILINEY